MNDDDIESQQTEEHRSIDVRHTRITDRPEIPKDQHSDSEDSIDLDQQPVEYGEPTVANCFKDYKHLHRLGDSKNFGE